MPWERVDARANKYEVGEVRISTCGRITFPAVTVQAWKLGGHPAAICYVNSANPTLVALQFLREKEDGNRAVWQRGHVITLRCASALPPGTVGIYSADLDRPAFVIINLEVMIKE